MPDKIQDAQFEGQIQKNVHCLSEIQILSCRSPSIYFFLFFISFAKSGNTLRKEHWLWSPRCPLFTLQIDPPCADWGPLCPLNEPCTQLEAPPPGLPLPAKVAARRLKGSALWCPSHQPWCRPASIRHRASSRASLPPHSQSELDSEARGNFFVL